MKAHEKKNEAEELEKWRRRVKTRRGLAFLRDDVTGETALMSGLRRRCSLGKLRVLLQHPDCAKCSDKKGMPLHVAIRNEYRVDAIMELFRAYEEAAKVFDEETQCLPLHMLLDSDFYKAYHRVEGEKYHTADVCRAMLEFYPESSQISCHDRIPLHFCLERGSHRLLQSVLSEDRLAAAVPMSGALPLHVALRHHMDHQIIGGIVAAHPGALLQEMPSTAQLPVEFAMGQSEVNPIGGIDVVINLIGGCSAGGCSADPRVAAYARASVLGLVTKKNVDFDDAWTHYVALEVELTSLPVETMHWDVLQESYVEYVRNSICDLAYSLPPDHRVKVTYLAAAQTGAEAKSSRMVATSAGAVCSVFGAWESAASAAVASARRLSKTLQTHTRGQVSDVELAAQEEEEEDGDRPQCRALTLEARIETTEALGEKLVEELRQKRPDIEQEIDDKIRGRLSLLDAFVDYEGELARADFEGRLAAFRVGVREARLVAMKIQMPIVSPSGEKFVMLMGLDDTVRDIKMRLGMSRSREGAGIIVKRLRLADDSVPDDALSCSDLVLMLRDLAALRSDGGALRLEESHQILQTALRCKVDDQVVEELLAQGCCRVDKADFRGMLPLHLAMLSGVSSTACERLLSCFPRAARAHIHGCGRYPLDLALEQKFPASFVDALVEAGEPGGWTDDGFYNPEGIRLSKRLRLPLHVAVCNGYPVATLKRLGDSGCRFNATDKMSGESLLSCAMRCNRAEELDAAFPSAMYSIASSDVVASGHRPLHQAVASGAPEGFVRRMCNECRNEEVGRSTELLIRDVDGNLPIHLACARRATPMIVRVLLDFAPEAALERDRNGRLPIHLAVEHQAKPGVIVELLSLEEGMVGAVSPCGRNLLELAAKVDAPLWVIEELLDFWPEDFPGFNLLSQAWPLNRASADIQRLLEDREVGASAGRRPPQRRARRSGAGRPQAAGRLDDVPPPCGTPRSSEATGFWTWLVSGAEAEGASVEEEWLPPDRERSGETEGATVLSSVYGGLARAFAWS